MNEERQIKPISRRIYSIELLRILSGLYILILHAAGLKYLNLNESWKMTIITGGALLGVLEYHLIENGLAAFMRRREQHNT